MKEYLNSLGQAVGFPVPDWKARQFPSHEPMEGRFCRLEALDPAAHAAPLHEAIGPEDGGRMWTYLPYGPFDLLESYRAWMAEMCQRTDLVMYAIIDRQTGQVVGSAGYLRIDPAAGSIEVGHLNYSDLLKRTPAATEAMYLMMERAFGMGYRRYEWKCDSLNGPSRSAALRLGFSFEGIFRQALVVKGHNRDTAWFSIIDAEWPARREAFQRWLNPSNFDEQGKQRTRLAASIISFPPKP